MAEPNATEPKYYENLQTWCDAVAGLVADALTDGKIITVEEIGPAAEIISEELWTRLLIGDYPPPVSEAPHLSRRPGATGENP